jgi:hypothetical protein
MRRLPIFLCLLMVQAFWCSAQEPSTIPFAILYPDGNKELQNCARRLEKLLAGQNFSVKDLSLRQRENFWETRENRERFGQWLMAAGVHWVVELETGNDGKLYNLAGRLFARFDPAAGDELVQKLQQSSQRWREAPEYFLCFRHCNNDRIRHALNNLQQQGTILWIRPPWDVEGRLQEDCAYPHTRDFVLVVKEAAGLGWFTRVEQYGHVITFHGTDWLLWAIVGAAGVVLGVLLWQYGKKKGTRMESKPQVQQVQPKTQGTRFEDETEAKPANPERPPLPPGIHIGKIEAKVVNPINAKEVKQEYKL